MSCEQVRKSGLLKPYKVPQSAAAALLGKWSVTNCESHVTGFLPQSAGTTLHRLRDFIDRSFGFGVLTQLFSSALVHERRFGAVAIECLLD
jgi:hypothetical protein